MQELNVQVWESSSRSAGLYCTYTIKYKISKSAGKCYTRNGPSHVGRRLTPLRSTSSLCKS